MNYLAKNQRTIYLTKTTVAGCLVTFDFDVSDSMAPFFTARRMFAAYDFDLSGIPVSLLNAAFVANVLPLVWLTDGVLWVDQIDETYYRSMPRIKQAFQDLYAHVPLKGLFIAARPEENAYVPEREALLLYTRGLDSSTSWVRHRDKKPVLCNVQGWLPDAQSASAASEADRLGVGAFARDNGADFCFIRSNFAALINADTFASVFQKTFHDAYWSGFQHSTCFIALSMPAAFRLRIRRIYIASSVSLGMPAKCASHPTTDIESRFAGAGGVVYDGSELIRQQKAGIIADHQRGVRGPFPLLVCSFNDHNCCACEKCFRTVLNLVAEGADVRQFGFAIEGDLTDHFIRVFEKGIVFFDVYGESRKHWPSAALRMRENYENIPDKRFVDWFLGFDFAGQKKRAVFRYRARNFFPLAARHLKARLRRGV